MSTATITLADTKAEEAVQALVDANAYGLFECRADREEAVGIVGRAIRDLLNSAWEKVNALGGAHDGSDYNVGYGKALDDALAEIEKLGGRDPLAARL